MSLPDSNQVPPITLAFAGLILAMKPDSATAALAFVASVALFAFVRWIERKKDERVDHFEMRLRDLQTKVDNLILGKSLGR
jgi:hypothetical protein